LRVLQIHNRYKIFGGEDVAVKSEYILLKKNNNEVDFFWVTNKDIYGVKAKIKTAINVGYSQKYSKKLSNRIKDFKPEIIHVHNFFPLLTPSIYDISRNLGVPVIQTLHNYRIVCPGAYLMRNGRVCEDCLTASAYRSVIHGCYRESRIGSFVLANMVQRHRKRETWKNKVNIFIALTQFSKNKFILAGLPSERIHVKPNFIYPDPGMEKCNGKYALFVGRISREKGILTLVRAYEKILGITLKIIGDGPLIEDVNKIKREKNLYNIELIGKRDRKEVFKFMKGASFILFPSECFETFGNVCAEAFSCGKPVVASRLGSLAEMVEDGVTGLLFEPGNSDDLAQKVQWLIDHPNVCRRMGKNARQVFLEKYTAEKNYKILMNIYQKAICGNK